jgi:hypothetical protein
VEIAIQAFADLNAEQATGKSLTTGFWLSAIFIMLTHDEDHYRLFTGQMTVRLLGHSAKNGREGNGPPLIAANKRPGGKPSPFCLRCKSVSRRCRPHRQRQSPPAGPPRSELVSLDASSDLQSRVYSFGKKGVRRLSVAAKPPPASGTPEHGAKKTGEVNDRASEPSLGYAHPYPGLLGPRPRTSRLASSLHSTSRIFPCASPSADRAQAMDELSL